MPSNSPNSNQAMSAADISVTLAALKEHVASLEKQVLIAQATEQRQSAETNRHAHGKNSSERLTSPKKKSATRNQHIASSNQSPKYQSKHTSKPSAKHGRSRNAVMTVPHRERPTRYEDTAAIRRVDSMSQASVGPEVLDEIKLMSGSKPSKSKTGRRSWWNRFRGSNRGNTGSAKKLNRGTASSKTYPKTKDQRRSSHGKDKKKSKSEESKLNHSSHSSSKPPLGRCEQTSKPKTKVPPSSSYNAQRSLVSNRSEHSATSNSSYSSSTSRASTSNQSSGGRSTSPKPSPRLRNSTGEIHPRTPTARHTVRGNKLSYTNQASRNSHHTSPRPYSPAPLGMHPDAHYRAASESHVVREIHAPGFDYGHRSHSTDHLIEAHAVPVAEATLFGEVKQRQAHRSGNDAAKDSSRGHGARASGNAAPKAKATYFAPSYANHQGGGHAAGSAVQDRVWQWGIQSGGQADIQQLSGAPRQRNQNAAREAANSPSPKKWKSPTPPPPPQTHSNSGHQAKGTHGKRGASPNRPAGITGFSNTEDTRHAFRPSPRSPVKSSRSRGNVASASASPPNRAPITNSGATGGNPMRAALMAQICSDQPKLKPSAAPVTQNASDGPHGQSAPAANGSAQGQRGAVVGAGTNTPRRTAGPKPSFLDEIRGGKPKLKSISQPRPVPEIQPESLANTSGGTGRGAGAGAGGGMNFHSELVATLNLGGNLKRVQASPKKPRQANQSETALAGSKTLASLRARQGGKSRGKPSSSRKARMRGDDWTAV